MNGAIFDATGNVFEKLRHSKLYDTVLATPMTPADVPVALEIEAQPGRGDDVDVEVGQGGTASGADAVEALTDDMEGIFSGEQQNGALIHHSEVTEKGAA